MSFLLTEDGSYLLLETGDHFILEEGLPLGTYNNGLYGGVDQSRTKLATINIDTIRPSIDNINKF